MKNIKIFTLGLLSIFTMGYKNFYSFENPQQKKVNNNTKDKKKSLIDKLAHIEKKK